MKSGDEKMPVCQDMVTTPKRKWTWHCVGYDEAGRVIVDAPVKLSRNIGLDLMATAGFSPLNFDYNVKEGESRLCGGEFYLEFINVPGIDSLAFLKRVVIHSFMFNYDLELDRVLSVNSNLDEVLLDPSEDVQTSLWIRYKTGISKKVKDGLVLRNIEQREEDRGLGNSDVLS